MVPEIETKKADNLLQNQLKVDMRRIKEKKENIVGFDGIFIVKACADPGAKNSKFW